MKTDIHPAYAETTVQVLVRQHVHHPLHQGRRAAHRALQRVPPVLHRQAEAGRLRWPRRALQQALRRAQGRADEVARRHRRDGDVPTRAPARLPRRLKLRALVRDHLGRDVTADARRLPARARRCVDDDVAWVLVEDDPGRGPRAGAGLGPPPRCRAGCHARSPTGHRAARPPGRSVRRADRRCGTSTGATLRPGRGRAAARHRRRRRPAHLALVPTIEAGGAVPVVEHGVVTGEVGASRCAGWSTTRRRARSPRGRRRRPRPGGVRHHPRRRADRRRAGRRRRGR